jgi:hypothetical protein
MTPWKEAPNATCETCPYWQEIKPLEQHLKIGRCHHAALAPVEQNGLFDFNWWCSEHPARQRDRLAATAMGGLVSVHGGAIPVDELAAFAYKVADAMLAARKGDK